MLTYILRRLLFMIPTIIIISIICFTAIQLPPGDFLTSYILELQEGAAPGGDEQIATLRNRYGLNQPFYMQYWKWIKGISQGDFGFSFNYNRPVVRLLKERLPYTILLSLMSLLFSWFISIPIGIYSAVKQYSVFDYMFTVTAFLGRSIPNFLLALVLMFVFYSLFGISVGGLFSPELEYESWSLIKVIDLLKHLIIPVIVVGTAGMAGMVRVLRATTLDELGKQYVETARAKGLKNSVIIIKHVSRIAMNPVFSTIGWVLPRLISGAMITSIVLSLPTTGPLIYNALMTQDMFLAGSILLIVSMLTLVGTLISDIILAISDPRIRYE